MTQLTINIEDKSILPRLLQMLKAFSGVSIDHTPRSKAEAEKEYLKQQLSQAVSDAKDHIDGKITLPNAESIHF